MGWMPIANEPDVVHTLYTMFKFVAASAVEVELGALFLNIKQG